MIFSLLRLNKKTSAVLAGMAIAAACLWGISLWQHIPPRQLLALFVGTILFLLGVMLTAVLAVALFHLVRIAVRAVTRYLANHSQR